jgi:hypothetical protein
VVVPAPGESDPDDRDRRVDGLEGVVPRREQRSCSRGGDVLPVATELGPEEGRLIGLVADDVLADAAERPGNRREPVGELRGTSESLFELSGWIGVDGEHDGDVVECGDLGHPLDLRTLRDIEKGARAATAV